ncbi:MAG: tRNA (cytidine(34)-2'-O)-methyltransferase [Nitrospinae bacterium]|nr:tRNA (cytidine(34)-2'-O)-methyltransferase [Nitrospinota bacterium]
MKNNGTILTNPDLNPFHIVLVEPEIPPNTGNISRLCVGTGSVLHLVGKLGFEISDRTLKRAGLDHWPHLNLKRHADWVSFKSAHDRARLLYFSKHGETPYTRTEYRPGDFLVFGSETKGLPREILEENKDSMFFIPTTGLVRSLNLSNACAVVLYEAIRQVDILMPSSLKNIASRID